MQCERNIDAELDLVNDYIQSVANIEHQEPSFDEVDISDFRENISKDCALPEN